LILGGGSLMILDEVGIPIVPLMGGAAVLGLAVAFGAQNLIKDYFSGFMVLLEDQYGINDVVQIGDVSGQVEHISLRITVLRDLEGVVHFIPHGTITTISNLTHGWSRALFDVGVAYKEDTDRVIGVLRELAGELRGDPQFGRLILDDPEMLGVDDLADSAVVIKFFVKTVPLGQWAVKRELLRRIKKRFDELGIEIPYPHHTVYHRYDNPPAALPPGAWPGAPRSRSAA
jgi:small-conductance mechanosensitive channel